MSQGEVDWDDYFYATPYGTEETSFVSSQMQTADCAITDSLMETHRSQVLPSQQYDISITDRRASLNIINEGLAFNPPIYASVQLQMPAAPAGQHLSVAAATNGPGGSSQQRLIQGFQQGSNNNVRIGNGRSSRQRRNISANPGEAAEQSKINKIKNRLSSAKYRAKKKAYIDYLEKRLDELAEENYHIKQWQEEAMRKRRQELEQEMNKRKQTKAEKTSEKFRTLRRTSSFPL